MSIEGCNSLRRAAEYFERELAEIRLNGADKVSAYAWAATLLRRDYERIARNVADDCAPWFEAPRRIADDREAV